MADHLRSGGRPGKGRGNDDGDGGSGEQRRTQGVDPAAQAHADYLLRRALAWREEGEGVMVAAGPYPRLI